MAEVEVVEIEAEVEAGAQDRMSQAMSFTALSQSLNIPTTTTSTTTSTSLSQADVDDLDALTALITAPAPPPPPRRPRPSTNALLRAARALSASVEAGTVPAGTLLSNCMDVDVLGEAPKLEDGDEEEEGGRGVVEVGAEGAGCGVLDALVATYQMQPKLRSSSSASPSLSLSIQTKGKPASLVPLPLPPTPSPLHHHHHHHLSAPAPASVSQRSVTIGREKQNTVVLDDSRVSRAHARVYLRWEKKANKIEKGQKSGIYPNSQFLSRLDPVVLVCEYVDLGSSLGSRVNGELVHKTVLCDGDIIEVGTSTIVVNIRYE
jgi:hypothetical protein